MSGVGGCIVSIHEPSQTTKPQPLSPGKQRNAPPPLFFEPWSTQPHTSKMLLNLRLRLARRFSGSLEASAPSSLPLRPPGPRLLPKPPPLPLLPPPLPPPPPRRPARLTARGCTLAPLCLRPTAAEEGREAGRRNARAVCARHATSRTVATRRSVEAPLLLVVVMVLLVVYVCVALVECWSVEWPEILTSFAAALALVNALPGPLRRPCCLRHSVWWCGVGVGLVKCVSSRGKRVGWPWETATWELLEGPRSPKRPFDGPHAPRFPASTHPTHAPHIPTGTTQQPVSQP